MRNNYRKILLIEDDPKDAKLIQEMLLEAGQPGFDINHFKSLSEAFRFLSVTMVDIILLNLFLTDSKGLSTYEKVSVKVSNVPIIILSGLIDENVALKAVQDGAQDYLVKDKIDSNLLIRAINYAIERKSNKDNIEKYKFIVDTTDEFMSLISTDYIYIAVNKSYCKVHKMQKDKIIGRSIEDIWGEYKFKKIIKKHLDKCFSGNVVKYKEWFNFIGLGERYFDVICYPYYNGDGKITHAVVVSRDITEQENIKNQLIYSEKLSAVSQLAAGVAHEFNNILAIISIKAQYAISNNIKGAELKNIFKVIHEQAKRGAEIIHNINSFVSIKSSKLKIIDIMNVIDTTIRMIEKQLNLKNIMIVKDYQKGLKIMGDSVRLQEVFLNLLINAHDAIYPKGKGIISIAAKNKNKYVEITVSDNGIGIDEKIKNNIFTPFFTTKGAMANDNFKLKGTGLGLPITHTIIKQHKGTISVKSKKKDGTTFNILLPLVKNNIHNKKHNVNKKLEVYNKNKFKSLKILVIDDEKEILIALQDVLKREGHSITISRNSKKALSIIKNKNFDVILLDIIMPGIRGEEILKYVKKINPNIKVIIISGKHNVDREKLLNSGAHDVIKKPFRISYLIKELREMSS